MPAAGDRVLVARETRVVYDVQRDDVIRLVQVVGTLTFARDRDTELNVGVLKVQNSDDVQRERLRLRLSPASNVAGEPQQPREGDAADAGSRHARTSRFRPKYTARIRLHYLEGMNKDDAPALVCCSARMDLHGAPLSRTWVKLGGRRQAGRRDGHARRAGRPAGEWATK